MPIIKGRANRVRAVRHICRLHEPNRDTLLLYARFIGDTVDDVLDELIESYDWKDRDFVSCAPESRTVPRMRPADVSQSVTPVVKSIHQR